jgi:hypothetical protein
MATPLIWPAGPCSQSQLVSTPLVLRRMSADGLVVFVALRVGTRIFSKGGGLGMDDYITVLCVVVMLVTCILITIGTQYGLGRGMEAIDSQFIPRALKWDVIISSVLIWTFLLPKFAIIAILKRILNYGLKTTILFWGLALIPGLYIGYIGLVVQAMRSGRIWLEQNHTGRKMCQYQGHVRFGLFHFGLFCLPRCVLRSIPDSVHYAPQHAT